MTKLMEWLFGATVFLSVWVSMIRGNLHPIFVNEWREATLFLPVIAVFLFGLYAATVVLYRVFTFNNCPEAAAELQQQIEAAKADLRGKGISLT